MKAGTRIEGKDSEADSQQIGRCIAAAGAVFARYRADPLLCAAASQKRADGQALSKQELLRCVIWDEAAQTAWRDAARGHLATAAIAHARQAQTRPTQFFGETKMLNSALFSIIEDAGEGVMVMTETVEKEEFLASKLTRREVQRRLMIIAGSAGNVAPEARKLMPELPWDGWETVARELNDLNPQLDEVLWFAVRALVPATMLWVQVYRENQPALFTFTA